jgi:hypothetical protein
MNIIESIATHNVNLAQHKGVKGKAREDLTVAVWNGAWAALNAVGDTENAQWVERVTVLLIYTRGFKEVQNIVAKIGKED